MEYPVIAMQTTRKTMPNSRICLKLLSMFFNDLNSIVLLFY